MLVSHRYKFLYTKTVKTGGTSVESYFERFCMPEGEWTLTQGREEYVSESGILGYRGKKIPNGCTWWNHMPAALIRQGVGEEIWASYFKFCVIRNPFDKAVSAFFFFRKTRDDSNLPDPSEAGVLDGLRAEFEAWLETSTLPKDRDKYLIDGKFSLDDVIRYERLASDLERIGARLGLPYTPHALPTFKSGIRPKGIEVGSLYTDRSRSIVEDFYKFELEYFNYTFPAGS